MTGSSSPITTRSSELPGTYKDQIERSINAGMDMVMIPDKYVEFFNTLKQLVTEGKVPQAAHR